MVLGTWATWEPGGPDRPVAAPAEGAEHESCWASAFSSLQGGSTGGREKSKVMAQTPHTVWSLLPWQELLSEAPAA